MAASLKDRYFHSSLLNELLTNTQLRESAAPLATLRYPAGTATRLKLRHSYNPDQPSTMHLGMTETIAAIEAGHQLCQSRGIQLLVVFVPTMVRAMAPYISFDRVADRKSYLAERIPNRRDFSGRIAELCARTGCTFIDAFDAFRQASANGIYNLYIPNDEHLDIGGHDVLARVIEDWLRDQNIANSKR